MLKPLNARAVRPDHLPQSDLQIRPWNQTASAIHKMIRPRSDHHIRQSDESQILPQIRLECTNSHTRPSSDQTTKISLSDQTTTATPDHQIRSTSNEYSTPHLVNWYRSGALFVGWVKGGK